MSDATFPCPVCGATLPGRARFCGECGSLVRGASAVKSAGGGTPNPVLPWFIAGVSVVAIQTLALILVLRPPTGPAGSGEPSANVVSGAPFAPGTPGTRATTDISSLTSRQAADRLYDRVARASEAGDTAQVQFFGPMALQAYANVTPLDVDARLHVGMIDIALGNFAAAGAQADSIARSSRTHLFGPLLKARVAEQTGGTGAARQAYQAFLANYDAERRKNLPEYEQHAGVLADTKTTAERAVRGR